MSTDDCVVQVSNHKYETQIIKCVILAPVVLARAFFGVSGIVFILSFFRFRGGYDGYGAVLPSDPIPKVTVEIWPGSVFLAGRGVGGAVGGAVLLNTLN